MCKPQLTTRALVEFRKLSLTPPRLHLPCHSIDDHQLRLAPRRLVERSADTPYRKRSLPKPVP
jgi:hypothetical protein